MRVRASAVALAIAVISYALLAATASALEPGVFVSPSSPSGKEYALPLPTARGQATGHPANPGAAEPLFGVGITPPASSHAASGAAKTRSNRSGQRSRGRRGQPPANSAGSEGAPGRNQVSRQELASLTHVGSAVPQVILWGALVLLGGLAIGGLLAFVGRRRSS